MYVKNELYADFVKLPKAFLLNRRLNSSSLETNRHFSVFILFRCQFVSSFAGNSEIDSPNTNATDFILVSCKLLFLSKYSMNSIRWEPKRQNFESKAIQLHSRFQISVPFSRKYGLILLQYLQFIPILRLFCQCFPGNMLLNFFSVTA